MSLCVFTASDEAIRQHITICNVRLCEICQSIVERWAAESRVMTEEAWRAEVQADEKLRKLEGR